MHEDTMVERLEAELKAMLKHVANIGEEYRRVEALKVENNN